MKRQLLPKFALFLTMFALLISRAPAHILLFDVPGRRTELVLISRAPAHILKDFSDGATRSILHRLLFPSRHTVPEDTTGDNIGDVADAVYRSGGKVVRRINAGATSFTDPRGHSWGGYFEPNSTRETTDRRIQQTDNQYLYQTQNVQIPGAPPMEIEFDSSVPPGIYQIRVHLAEIFSAPPGARVFDIVAEEDTLVARVDMASEAGDSVAFFKDAVVKCNDGVLNVKFISIEGLASFAGVELFQYEDSDPFKQVVARYNSGGPDFTDLYGRLWKGDASIANAGHSFAVGNEIDGTYLDPIYQTERYGSAEEPNILYTFPAEDGVYSVRLHFAELFSDAPGSRSFSVKIEDDIVLADFDILSHAQKFTSLVREFTVPVTDGSIDVELLYPVGSIGTAGSKINGIEVIHRGPFFLEVSSQLLEWEPRKLYDVGDKKTFYLRNRSDLPMPITNINFRNKRGIAKDFSLLINGIPYFGNYGDMEYQTDFVIPVKSYLRVDVRYIASRPGEHMTWVEFVAPYATVATALVGATDFEGPLQYHFLEPIVTGPSEVWDENGDGFELVTLDASQSIAFIGAIAGYEWRDESNEVIGTSSELQRRFPLGVSRLRLTIVDNDDNARYTDFYLHVNSAASGSSTR